MVILVAVTRGVSPTRLITKVGLDLDVLESAGTVVQLDRKQGLELSTMCKARADITLEFVLYFAMKLVSQTSRNRHPLC
jgi:hypothetical protein